VTASRSILFGSSPRPYFWTGFALAAILVGVVLLEPVVTGELDPTVAVIFLAASSIGLGSFAGHFGERAFRIIGTALRSIT